MRRKFIKLIIFSILISTGIYSKAYASVDGYLLKDNNNDIHSYNLKELTDSLITNTLGNNDPLYADFEINLNNGKIDLIHDSEGKYVDYELVKKVLIEKTMNGENFNLDSEVKSARASEKPALVEEVKAENNVVIRNLLVLKEGTLLEGSEISKDKYKNIVISADNVTITNLDINGEIVLNPGQTGKVKIDNVKCNKINILSGDKKGISFKKVESKEIKIDENASIEIQYEDSKPSGGQGGSSSGGGSTPISDEASKLETLKKVNSALNSLYPNLTSEDEKQVISKVISGINAYISDQSYNYQNDVEEAKKILKKMLSEDQIDFMTRIVEAANSQEIDIYELLSIFNISI